MTHFLDAPLWQTLGRVLLHFLWQGTAISILAWLFLRNMRERTASERYWVGCLALFAMAVVPMWTFLRLPRLVQPETAAAGEVAGELASEAALTAAATGITSIRTSISRRPCTSEAERTGTTTTPRCRSGCSPSNDATDRGWATAWARPTEPRSG